MSLTKIGSIGINTGIAFAGVTTIVTLNTSNDALSIGATVNVGSGITLGASGDIFATGVTTSSGGFVGDVTGAASQITVADESSDTSAFVVFTNTATGNNAPKTGSNLTFNSSSGALTATSFVGAVSGTTGTFSGAVSGTTGTFTGDVDIADKIVHTGDTDTAIRFPDNDNISFETGGTERLDITSSGIDVTGTAGADALNVTGTSIVATLKSTNNNYVMQMQGNNASDKVYFGTTSGNDFFTC